MAKNSIITPPPGVAPEYGTERPGPFSGREKKRLAAYVRDVADRLGLRDWTLELEWDTAVSDGSDGDAADAEVSPLYGRKFATVRFAAGFRRYSPAYQRYLICHELIHCHMGPADELVRRGYEAALGATAAAVAQHGYDQASEIAVDGLAQAFAQFIDLPDLG